ncbi:MAG: hypothetical protein KAG95_01020 [Bacteroidales bacterium]|nr:hypothetical protein [Bacteroidales bacterium]
MEIIHLKNNDIDKLKWDKCIIRSYNGIIYAFSWYLDVISSDWEALIVGDYDMIFPIIPKQKYCINYLYQPLFTQQFGVFSYKKLNNKIIEEFIDAIPKKYKFFEINLNTFNKIDSNKYKITQKITHEIDLISPHEKLTKNYSTNTKRNINKAKNNNLKILKKIPVKEFIAFKQKNSIFALKEKDYSVLKNIISISIFYTVGELYGVYNSDNQLCATAFFIKSHNKVIYLVSASSEEGKQKRAMFLLIDTFIKKNSQKNLTLDFEGSNIESIARFFKGFGAKPCFYQSVKKNKLPFFVKFFKK